MPTRPIKHLPLLSKMISKRFYDSLVTCDIFSFSEWNRPFPFSRLFSLVSGAYEITKTISGKCFEVYITTAYLWFKFTIHTRCQGGRNILVNLRFYWRCQIHAGSIQEFKIKEKVMQKVECIHM